MSIKHYQYCLACGTKRVEEANYCVHCGASLLSSQIISENDLKVDLQESVTNMELANFIPSLLNAFENISIGDFFKSFHTARLILVKPNQFVRLEKDHKLATVYSSLVTATFAGVFKLFQDPFYSPFLHKIDTGDDLSQGLLQFVLYLILALLFGFFAYLVAKAAYWIFRLKIEENLFIRFSLITFNTVSFFFDSFSPFWMIFVRKGLFPMGSLSVDLVRGGVIIMYVAIIYYGIMKRK